MAHKKQTLPRLLASALLSSSALLTLALLPATAIAQEAFNEDDLLVTGTDGADAGGSSFTDYLVGEFGLINGANGAVDRSSTIYNVGLNVPFSFGRFYATYGGVESEITVKQQLRDAPDVDQSQPKERSTTTKTDDTDLREAFVQFNLGSSVTLTAGRQRNPWGQFELFSPAVIMQPLNANFTSLLPNKLDLLQPQDQVKISIFPTSRMEFSLYAMSSVRTDKTAEEQTKQWVKPQTRLLAPGVIDDMSDTSDVEIELEEIEDPTQSAARLVIYPNWGTVAFTHHKGYNAFTPLLITGLGHNGQNLLAGTRREEMTRTRATIVASGYIDEENSYLYYPEGTLNAFEIAVPAGNWTWRYEMAVVESVAALDDFAGNLTLIPESQNTGFTDESVDELLDAAYAPERSEKLRGSALFESTRTTTGIGFQYQGAEWKLDVALLSLGKAKPTTPSGQRLVAAYKAVDDQTQDLSSDFEYLPLINGFRKRGDEDQHLYGFSLGAVGVGFGIGAIYSYSFTEDLSLGFSAGSITLDNNSSSEENDDYETNAEGLTTQVSLAWRF